MCLILFDFVDLHKFCACCHNPNDNTTQHNLNIVVGLGMKMTVQTPPHATLPQKLNCSSQEPQINIYWPPVNLYGIIWSFVTSDPDERQIFRIFEEPVH